MAGRLAVIDLETTAIFPWQGSIVQVAVAELDLGSGEWAVTMAEVVREATFNPQAEKNAIIFSEMTQDQFAPDDVMRGGRPWPEILERLRDYTGAPVAAWNKEFVFRWLRDRGLQIPLEAEDPLDACFRIMRPQRQGRYVSPTLAEAYQRFVRTKSLLQPPFYRARNDAVMAADLIYELSSAGLYAAPG